MPDRGWAYAYSLTGRGKLTDATPAVFSEHVGWWNGLNGADFDHDGDIDYVATNFGLNNLYHQRGEDYVGLYGADFDGNGGYDLLVSNYALAEDGSYQEYPHHQRTDTEKQVISIKQRYPRHDVFGRATIAEIVSHYPEAKLTVLRANYLRSAWIENLGKGDFAFHELPREAQVAPLFGLQLLDLNGDGYEDLIAVGNDYGTETGTGMQNALNGLVMLYAPDENNFVAQSLDRAGIFVPGNGRSVTGHKRKGSTDHRHRRKSGQHNGVSFGSRLSRDRCKAVGSAAGRSADHLYPPGAGSGQGGISR